MTTFLPSATILSYTPNNSQIWSDPSNITFKGRITDPASPQPRYLNPERSNTRNTRHPSIIKQRKVKELFAPRCPVRLLQHNTLNLQLQRATDQTTDHLLAFIKEIDRVCQQPLSSRKKIRSLLRSSLYPLYQKLNIARGKSLTTNLWHMLTGKPDNMGIKRPLLQEMINLCKKYPGISLAELLETVSGQPLQQQPGAEESAEEKEWLDFLNTPWPDNDQVPAKSRPTPDRDAAEQPSVQLAASDRPDSNRQHSVSGNSWGTGRWRKEHWSPRRPFCAHSGQP